MLPGAGGLALDLEDFPLRLDRLLRPRRPILLGKFLLLRADYADHFTKSAFAWSTIGLGLGLLLVVQFELGDEPVEVVVPLLLQGGREAGLRVGLAMSPSTGFSVSLSTTSWSGSPIRDLMSLPNGPSDSRK